MMNRAHSELILVADDEVEDESQAEGKDCKIVPANSVKWWLCSHELGILIRLLDSIEF